MSTLVLGLRLMLALVLAAAAAGKLADRAGSMRALRDFGLPQSMLAAGAVVLPLVELSIAGGLMFTVSARAAAAATLLLVTCFIAAIGWAISRGQSPDCHCFGQLHSEPAGRETLARNAVLAAAAVVALAGAPGRSLTDLPATDLALVLTSLATASLLLASITLWRENRRLRASPTGRPAPLTRGLPTGSAAPDITLSTLTGETVSLSTLIGAGRPAALVQISPKCGPCRTLLPELSRWQRTLRHQLAVLAVSSGELEDNRALAQEHGLERLYLESGGQPLGDAYQVKPTPSAVLIDEHGKIAAAPATGAVAIEALIRLALERLPAPV